MTETKTNTKTTTPCIIWTTDVIETACVSVEQMEQHCGRDRLHRWFNDEMPVWMAADSLRQFVTNGERHAKCEREVNYLHGKMKVSS